MNKIYFIIILNIISSSISAAVRNVPANYSTISLAINSSVSGDTILVGSGIYFENISINNSKTGLKIMSVLGSSNTIIDGGGIGTVIRINGNDSMDAQTLIEGFTIQNGYSIKGGGCYLTNTNVLFHDAAIKNDTIKDVNGNCKGAGLLGVYSSITLINCSVKGNLIVSSDQSEGAGINCGRSTLNLDHCNIESNISYATSMNYGGGIFVEYGYLNINACKIQGNSIFSTPFIVSTHWNFGGGLFLNDVIGDIANSLITDNYVDTNAFNYWAGGINITTSNTVTNQKISIRHCTIANNYSGLSSYGNSIRNNIPANAPIDALTLINCILWSDCLSELGSSKIFIPQVYSCDIKDTLFSGSNSIHTDPLFVSQHDFHLQSNSPCVNMGLQIINSDLDNNFRPMPIGHLPDMGCYEIDESINEIKLVQNNTPKIYISESSERLVVKNSEGIYRIYNLSGQKILSGVLQDNIENSIDISRLPMNMYLISIFKNKTESFSRKFLIMK